jgi:outer membrane protein OmpA-like peptidoglycan-associated protein
MKKKTTTLRLVSLTLVVVFSLTGAVLAQERLVPKVDNFILLIDKSGSMFLTEQGAVPTKAELAKVILTEMNGLIPELDYIGAIQSFPPSKILVGPKRYDRNSFGKAIEDLPVKGTIFGNRTPLGNGILDLGEVLKEMPRGKTAVIIFSDGEENLGVEALKAEDRLRAKYSNVSFHTVSMSDKEKERATLREMSRRTDGIYVEGRDLSSDKMALERFVKEVFYLVQAPLDSDGDGVIDDVDKCPNTPTGMEVDAQGCPLDSDGDGVVNYADKCPSTPPGVAVDSSGCPPDSDGDGVPDYLDQCPNTPVGATVNEVGCWSLKATMLFDTNSSYIKSEAHPLLDEVASILEKNPQIEVEIQGHADNTGTAEYNQWLSERRAKRVMDYLVTKGIALERLEAKGYGSTRAVGSNATEEGRAQNRRVELRRMP